MIKIISAKWSKVAVAFVTTLCFSFNSFAVSSQIVNSFYNYAHYGQTSQMRQLMKMGYGIDVEDDNGVGGWRRCRRIGWRGRWRRIRSLFR